MSLAAGGLHTLAISADQGVYVWGRGEGGQLGLPLETLQPARQDSQAIEVFLTRPRRVPDLSQAKKVSCGDAHSLVLTFEGRVFAFGYNNVGQLALPEESVQQQMTPLEILQGLNKRLVDIECGSMFSYYTAFDGTIYASGLNDQA